MDTSATRPTPIILFLKAALPGGAAADLFAAPVDVAGYVTQAGTYVAPHHATRRKRLVVLHPQHRPGQADMFAAPKPAAAPVAPAAQPSLFDASAPKATGKTPLLTEADIDRRLAALKARRDPDGIEDAPAAAAPALPAADVMAIAPELTEDSLPLPKPWLSHSFETVVERLAEEAPGGIFTAADLASHWRGRTEDDALDMLHAHARDYALMPDGQRWMRIEDYLASADPVETLRHVRDALAGDLPNYVRGRLQEQARRLTEAAVTRPKPAEQPQLPGTSPPPLEATATPPRVLRDLPIEGLTDDEARRELSDIKGDLGADYGYAAARRPAPGSPQLQPLYDRARVLRERFGQEPWQRTAEQVQSVLGMPAAKHREVVAQAIEAGKVVPYEVLAEYPDLRDANMARFREGLQARLRQVGATYREIGDEHMARVTERMADSGSSRGVLLPDNVERIEARLAEVLTQHPLPQAGAIAHPNDLAWETVEGAHRWISMTPEKSAFRERQEYAREVNGIQEALGRLADTPEQQALLAAEMDRFKSGYLQHLSGVLAARARTASPMVTGPARFPVARNEKALRTEHARIVEMADWKKRAIAAIRRALTGARTEDQVKAELFDALRKDIDGNIATVRAIDSGDSRMRGMDRAAFVNSVTGKLKRLAAGGHADLLRQALDHIRETQQGMAKPFLSERSGVWTLPDQAPAAAPEAAPSVPEGQEEVAAYRGARIVNNHDEKRVQIHFDAKPDDTVREALKSAGWRWSPRNGVWQRQNTASAISSAKHILGRHLAA